MEVNLSPDLEGKLARVAGRRGVSADVLFREAIERAVDYDDWFIREVENGLGRSGSIDPGSVLRARVLAPSAFWKWESEHD